MSYRPTPHDPFLRDSNHPGEPFALWHINSPRLLTVGDGRTASAGFPALISSKASDLPPVLGPVASRVVTGFLWVHCIK